MNSKTQQLLALMGNKGVLRPRELAEHGIPRECLRRLVQSGRIDRVGRGLYMLPEAPITEHHSLVEACKSVPQGVGCLLTALRFHDLTTQNPFQIWLAVERKAWRPRDAGLRLRIVRFSGRAFEEGIEEHLIEGVRVRVYGAAKTVADCFKYRNKIGLDVALEALRDYRRAYRTGLDELWRFAEICRVSQVMRPYLEVLQ